MSDNWSACKGAAADPEGAFTVAAAEASLVAGAEEPGPAAAGNPEGAFTAATAEQVKEGRGCGEQAGPVCGQDKRGVQCDESPLLLRKLRQQQGERAVCVL